MTLSINPWITSARFVIEKIGTILFVSLIMCTWAYGENVSQFDYNIEVLTGSTMAVYQGFAGRNAVHLALLSGLPNDVTLSISGLPLGATAAFDHTNICQFDREFGAPPFQSTLGFKVMTAENTPLGTYRIKVAGSGGGIIRSTSFNLMVEAVPNSGRLHYVSVTGNDGNSGNRLSPFKTIQKAANLVQPGDVVIVEPGLYRERVRVKSSGLSDKQIMFLGKDGAIIDGGTVVKGWTRDDSIYPGAYKKPLSEIAFEPMYMAWNNKFVLVWEVYDDMRAVMNSELSADASSELYSFAGAYGVTLGNDFYVKFRDNRSPDDEDFTLSPSEAAFEIDGHCYNTISGFTVRNAFRNVSLQNGACFNAISNNYIRGGSYGIDINSGSHDNIVNNNDITLDHYYEDLGHSLYRGNYYPADRVSWPLFNHLRHAARWVQKPQSIHTDNSSNLVVSQNHIYRSGVGVGVNYDISGNIKISSNYMYNNAVYSVYSFISGKLNTFEINDNLIYEGTDNVRLDGMPRDARLYIYRNRFKQLSSVRSIDLTTDFSVL